jgi:hypothetical protein
MGRKAPMIPRQMQMHAPIVNNVRTNGSETDFIIMLQWYRGYKQQDVRAQATIHYHSRRL